ncbi:MAG: DEAD/DEAH box helicase [Polyangiaceae bacterium]|jgi:superfamily II DNA or RNA helicase
MPNLLDAVRTASLPGLWSNGVKLARDGAVTFASLDGEEIVARVRSPGRAVALTVTLYVGSEEWSCDCSSPRDPCEHVTAAVIAYGQAAPGDPPRSQGEHVLAPKSTATRPARLVYRLGRRDGVLSLTRWVVRPDGGEVPLKGLLSTDLARTGGVVAGTSVALTPTHEDLAIERILGLRDLVYPARVGDVFEALSSGAEVTFEGSPVRISGERVLPKAVLEDARGGFVLRLDRDPSITEVVARGVVRCGDTLRPIEQSDTTGELLERLPAARTFAKAEAVELVTKVLPELEKTIEVTVLTRKLPRRNRTADIHPRIDMDLAHHGHTLSVLPTLVYGSPSIARVDGDSLTLLGREVPVRRPSEEHSLVQRLRDELNLAPGRRVDLDGAEAIRFATKLRDWQRRTNDGETDATFASRELQPRLELRGESFELTFDCDDDDSAAPRRAEAATVIRAWRDGLDLVPLDAGGWAPLPAGWLAKYGHLVADLLAAREAGGPLRRASLPALGELCDAMNTPRPPELARLTPLFEGFTGIPRAELPQGIRAELRAYQQDGVDWLTFLRDAELGAILADDMGLGKTLETICALRGRTLVVCPKSVIHNWVDELARFRPALRSTVYHGQKRELDEDADVTLTTYAVLRLDAHVLTERTFDVVVLDEAQAIKNFDSQTARAAFELRGAFRVALSGTPVENRLEELWSVMHFANPGLLGGVSDFRERYVGPIASGQAEAAERLRAKIRPFVLRRTKAEVLPELPPRTDCVLHVELDESERQVYDAVRAATKQSVIDKLAQGGGAGALAALEALLRLRQAACHTALVPGQRAESSSKVERLVEALEESVAAHHKALVFSQWTSLLDLVEPHLARAGIGFTRLDGSTVDRGAVVREFQSDDGPPVMIVSLKAGGTGLNLTAADHVFLLDPWWNPAVEDQAADRAHRIGQDRPVMVHRMVSKDTVEERMLVLQEKKRKIADVALGGASQATAITREELLALIA